MMAEVICLRLQQNSREIKLNHRDCQSPAITTTQTPLSTVGRDRTSSDGRDF